MVSALRVHVVGSGDAFGSGGRLQACFFVEANSTSFLIDCGCSALSGLRRLEIEPNRVERILLSHLHGDHFGGVPFFVLDAQLVSKRTSPLVVAGPSGTEQRVLETMEALFPGSSRAERRFGLEFVEFELERPNKVGPLSVVPYEVRHPSGAPALALRVECAGRVLAYSGDTEWVESLVAAAQGADLLIAEAYFYEKRVPYHLDYRTLAAQRPRLRCRRVVLTHMSADMLTRGEQVDCECAEDGMRIEL
jgi:ribonuclease BN (tRNA processing enzyme)